MIEETVSYNALIQDKKLQLNHVRKALKLCADNVQVKDYLEKWQASLQNDLSRLKDKRGGMRQSRAANDIKNKTDVQQVMKALLKRHKLPMTSPLSPLLKESLPASIQAQDVPGSKQYPGTLRTMMKTELADIAEKGQQLPGNPKHQQCLQELLEQSLTDVETQAQALPGNTLCQTTLLSEMKKSLQDVPAEKRSCFGITQDKQILIDTITALLEDTHTTARIFPGGPENKQALRDLLHTELEEKEGIK